MTLSKTMNIIGNHSDKLAKAIKQPRGSNKQKTNTQVEVTKKETDQNVLQESLASLQKS